jgi:hypothetical protein
MPHLVLGGSATSISQALENRLFILEICESLLVVPKASLIHS